MSTRRNGFRPRISVIVPVRNEAGHLRRTLDGLTSQRFPARDVEILVVDGASDDGTLGVVRDCQRRHANIAVFHNARRLSSSARNIAVREARGDFLVLVDGHCEIQNPDYLSNVAAAFDRSEADTLGRPQPLKAGALTPFRTAVSAARMSWLGHNPDSAIFDAEPRFVDADNVAVAYRREVFDRVGLFDESFDACEDVDFNTRVRRAGLTCYFTPTLSVDYQPRQSLTAVAFQMMRYGRGRARLARKDRGTVTKASLVPPLSLLGLVIAIVASVFWWPMALATLAAVAAYAAIVTGETLRLAAKHTPAPVTAQKFRIIDDEEMLVPDDRRAEDVKAKGTMRSRVGLLVRLPLVFPAIHFGFACGYLRELAWGAPLKPAPTLPPAAERPLAMSA